MYIYIYIWYYYYKLTTFETQAARALETPVEADEDSARALPRNLPRLCRFRLFVLCMFVLRLFLFRLLFLSPSDSLTTVSGYESS